MSSFALRDAVTAQRESLTRHRRPIRGALLLISLAGGGCSLLLVEGPPTGHEAMATFSCSESHRPPILDVALAGFWVWAAYLPTDTDGNSTGSMGDTVLFTLAHGASAFHGFRNVSECRRARTEAAQRAAAAQDHVEQQDSGRLGAPYPRRR